MHDAEGQHTHGTDPLQSVGAPGVPKWLKVAGAVVAVVALLLLLLVVLGGGNHGPGRHQTSGVLERSLDSAAGTGANSFEGLTGR